MAEGDPPSIQECGTCGALIDTGDEQPLALIHCSNCGAATRVRRMFDHFEIQEVLGAGGMGAVYRAYDTKLNRPVALKVLRAEHMDNPALIESLTKEAAITASINHPHVVKVYSTGTTRGVFYIAMELVDKGSLDDLIGLQKKVGELQVLEVGVQIAQGLGAALQRGLIHRDVKPGNILFADAHRAKITDFGLAVLQEHAGQLSGEVWGTPYYVAPEKLDTPPREDFRSDLYSLGATLFHALAGRPPFEAETASMVALKHLKSQAVSLQAFAPEISSATTFVINKALNKDPEQRHDSYEELAKSLQYAHDQLVEAARNPQRKRGVVVSGENEEAMGWLTIAMVAIIVGAGVLVFVFRDRLFPAAATAAVQTPSQHVVPSRGVDAELAAARQQLAAGQYAEAAAALRALDAKPGIQQPTQNWITLHGALAFLLLGHMDDARAELLKLEGRGMYSPDSLEQPLAKFFVETARLTRQPEPQPGALAASYDKASFECLALLIFAAKNWSLGAFEEAGPFLAEFKSSTPPERYGWIADFKPIAEAFAADLGTYRAAATAVRRADSAEKQRLALDLLRNARGRLKQGGALVSYFDREEDRLQKLVQLNEEKEAQTKAESEAADLKTLATLRSRMKSFCDLYKFAEAARVFDGVAMKGEKGKAGLRLWMDYVDGLARFKRTLINDINARGYAQPLQRRSGSLLPAGTLRANEMQIELVSQFGSVPTLWADLAPATVINMAGTYLKMSPPANVADRQWLLGLYLLNAGMQTQGFALLQQAAETRPELQALLPRYHEAFTSR